MTGISVLAMCCRSLRVAGSVCTSTSCTDADEADDMGAEEDEVACQADVSCWIMREISSFKLDSSCLCTTIRLEAGADCSLLVA